MMNKTQVTTMNKSKVTECELCQCPCGKLIRLGDLGVLLVSLGECVERIQSNLVLAKSTGVRVGE
jgi:hypothetical protein